ncbi:MAG TPA: glycosyltransferase [Candidatus Paceibacterota bacterium]|nr:glycosyltransferase [Candidatus Paceibacterota bacterium]
MEVIAISLARGVLHNESRERARMRLYAEKLDHLHMVVCTRKIHGDGEVMHEDKLSLYPTHTRTRMGMLIRAYQIGRDIATHTRTPETCVVSAQDPLETGWIAYFLAWRANARFHVQVHGDYFDSRWRGRSLTRMVKHVCALALLRRAPAIRVVSERIKRSLIKRGISESRIMVLPIRPELEEFLKSTAHPYREGEPFVFLFVGRLSPEKDIPRIIMAFDQVYKKNRNIRLQLVGSGGEEKRIRALVTSYALRDVVSLVPWESDIAARMSRAHALVLASKHEAYGLVLIEAMAVGLPLITTDVGCAGEVVRDGIQGIVVSDNSVASFARAMSRMIEDEGARTSYARHAKAAARSLSQSYSSETYRDAWVQSLSRAL